MSLTSNNPANAPTNNATQSEIDYLLLDLGLYPTSEPLGKSLVEPQADLQQANDQTIIRMDLNTEPMSDADWDAALDNILKAKRCITL